MAKKLTPEQEQEFAEIAADFPGPDSEETLCRNLSEKRDNDLLLSPELQAFFGQKISHVFFRR
jgi:hypothetical protein